MARVKSKKAESADTTRSTSKPSLEKTEDDSHVEFMLAHSNLGQKGVNMTFDNHKRTKENVPARKAVAKWTSSISSCTGRGLVLYGPTGTGKTHLACAAINRLIRQYKVFALFLPVYRIPRNDQELLLALTDPSQYPVLVLDDFGTEKLTERALECLHTIVDGRLHSGAPMIITTNFDKEKLRERIGGDYGERLVGRLCESCDWVPVGGKDRRARM